MHAAEHTKVLCGVLALDDAGDASVIACRRCRRCASRVCRSGTDGRPCRLLPGRLRQMRRCGLQLGCGRDCESPRLRDNHAAVRGLCLLCRGRNCFRHRKPADILQDKCRRRRLEERDNDGGGSHPVHHRGYRSVPRLLRLPYIERLKCANEK